MVSYFAKAVSVDLPSDEKPTLAIRLFSSRFKSGGSQTPTISRRVKLFCRAGYSIAVTANNTVRGVDEAFCLKTARCKFKKHFLCWIMIERNIKNVVVIHRIFAFWARAVLKRIFSKYNKFKRP